MFNFKFQLASLSTTRHSLHLLLGKAPRKQLATKAARKTATAVRYLLVAVALIRLTLTLPSRLGPAFLLLS